MRLLRKHAEGGRIPAGVYFTRYDATGRLMPDGRCDRVSQRTGRHQWPVSAEVLRRG